jgi:hypothetical protein
MFLPAIGKVNELTELDQFLWATVHGWTTLPLLVSADAMPSTVSTDAETEEPAQALAARLEDEIFDRSMLQFADDQASNDYPYLLSLVTVRLWALLKAAAPEFCVAAVK